LSEWIKLIDEINTQGAESGGLELREIEIPILLFPKEKPL